jgi:hypothetical protein
MKGLDDVSALGSAPTLEEFIHVLAQNMEPEQYDQLLKLHTLKRVLLHFGSNKKNSAAQKLIAQKGIEEFDRSDFKFI